MVSTVNAQRDRALISRPYLRCSMGEEHSAVAPPDCGDDRLSDRDVPVPQLARF
jgi:hypothetical protein